MHDGLLAVRISEKQFDTLIARPLQLVMAGRALILVIPDVLDECDADGATTILSLIACEIPNRAQSLRHCSSRMPNTNIMISSSFICGISNAPLLKQIFSITLSPDYLRKQCKERFPNSDPHLGN